MDGQAKREHKIREDVEKSVAEQLQKLREAPSAFDEVLATLEDYERDARLTSNTAAVPIYASGLLQAYLLQANIKGALTLFTTLIKRRSQTNEAIVRCSTVLEEYLANNYNDDNDFETLEPLLTMFTETIGSLMAVEAINVRQSIRLLRMLRREGKRDESLKIAENLSADVAGSIPYIDRVEATLEQLETALYFKELVLADIIFNRIKEKTLTATTAAVYKKGNLDLGVRLSEAQRRYYVAQYLIALGDNRMDAICRAAWLAASTYLTRLNKAKVLASSRLSNDDLMKCASLLSTAAVAGLLAGFSKVSDVMEEMRKSTLFSENIAYCARAYRCISSLIHPFAKCLFRRSLHTWRKIETDFKQGAVCKINQHVPLPDNLSYDIDSIKEATYCAKIELFGPSSFSVAFDGSETVPQTEEAFEFMWSICKSAYIEEYVANIMPFYDSTTLDSLAELVDCDPEDIEVALINYDGYLAIDRPRRTVQMSRPMSTDEQLAQWLENTRAAITNIAEISQLIEMDVRFN